MNYMDQAWTIHLPFTAYFLGSYFASSPLEPSLSMIIHQLRTDVLIPMVDPKFPDKMQGGEHPLSCTSPHPLVGALYEPCSTLAHQLVMDDT